MLRRKIVALNGAAPGLARVADARLESSGRVISF